MVNVGQDTYIHITLFIKLVKIFSELKSDNFIIKKNIFTPHALFYKIAEWETDD